MFYRLGVCYEHLRVYSHYVFGVVCTRMGVFCVLVFVYRDTVLFFGGWGCPVIGTRIYFMGVGVVPLKRGHGCPGIMWRVSPFLGPMEPIKGLL